MEKTDGNDNERFLKLAKDYYSSIKNSLNKNNSITKLCIRDTAILKEPVTEAFFEVYSGKDGIERLFMSVHYNIIWMSRTNSIIKVKKVVEVSLLYQI